MNLSRFAWRCLGFALLGTGIVGLFVPGLPTTIFLILSLACFKKGSAKMEAWLLNHPRFGASLRDWEENKWISKRVKWIAVGSMAVFGGASILLFSSLWAKGSVAALCLFGAWYVLSRRTKPDQQGQEPVRSEGETPTEANPQEPGAKEDRALSQV